MSDDPDDSEWVPYEGPEGGEGWRHEPTGAVEYTEERPTTDPRDKESPTARKQILTIRPVRQYVKDHAKDHGMTVSEYLDRCLPVNWNDIIHTYEDDDMVRMKVVSEVHEKVVGMTGDRVNVGEVVAFYVLLDAMARRDYETAAEIVRYIPHLTWNDVNQVEDEVAT